MHTYNFTAKESRESLQDCIGTSSFNLSADYNVYIIFFQFLLNIFDQVLSHWTHLTFSSVCLACYILFWANNLLKFLLSSLPRQANCIPKIICSTFWRNVHTQTAWVPQIPANTQFSDLTLQTLKSLTTLQDPVPWKLNKLLISYTISIICDGETCFLS